jgi:hypothetical protein
LLGRPRRVAYAIQRVAKIRKNAGINFSVKQRLLQRPQFSYGARQPL